MDREAFCQDILRSDLFASLQSDPDEYADLLDAEVTRILDIYAPLRTGRRRSSSQHDTHVLSDEAQQAKQLRRCLERRCRRTGLQADKQAYDAACKAARDSIMKFVLTTSGPSCRRFLATFGQRGKQLRVYCTADSGLFTTTRNAPTLSTSSVIFSLTKNSAFVTTSQRHYSSPLTDCLPLDRTPDRSCRLSSRWQLARFGSC